MAISKKSSDIDQDKSNPYDAKLESNDLEQPKKRRSLNGFWAAILIITYFSGLGSGYGLWGRTKPSEPNLQADTTEFEVIAKQTFPKEGFLIPVSFGDLGPQMIDAGVINRDLFVKTYSDAGQPLTEDQMGILDGTYSGNIYINHENAYFMLNFLWALGLSNKNSILDWGPIQEYSDNNIEGFASTGGWTIATRPINEIFSSQDMINLTAEQQKRVEEAAAMIFRPCCNNPTLFPDCNHGMAMLGLLELMASQGSSLETILNTAKYVNAYWFPRQTLEQAIYFKKVEGKNFQEVDAKTILGTQYSSSAGYAKLNQYLSEKQWLPKSSNSGSSCGV